MDLKSAEFSPGVAKGASNMLSQSAPVSPSPQGYHSAGQAPLHYNRAVFSALNMMQKNLYHHALVEARLTISSDGWIPLGQVSDVTGVSRSDIVSTILADRNRTYELEEGHNGLRLNMASHLQRWGGRGQVPPIVYFYAPLKRVGMLVHKGITPSPLNRQLILLHHSPSPPADSVALPIHTHLLPSCAASSRDPTVVLATEVPVRAIDLEIAPGQLLPFFEAVCPYRLLIVVMGHACYSLYSVSRPLAAPAPLTPVCELVPPHVLLHWLCAWYPHNVYKSLVEGDSIMYHTLLVGCDVDSVVDALSTLANCAAEAVRESGLEDARHRVPDLFLNVVPDALTTGPDPLDRLHSLHDANTLGCNLRFPNTTTPLDPGVPCEVGGSGEPASWEPVVSLPGTWVDAEDVPPPPASCPEPRETRVVSWNVLSNAGITMPDIFLGASRRPFLARARSHKVRSIILESGADIVGLQETGSDLPLFAHLRDNGFAASYADRPCSSDGSVFPVGVALAWKKARYSKEEEEVINMECLSDRHTLEGVLGCNLDHVSPSDLKRFHRYNRGLILRLKCRETGLMLIVGCAHLQWDPCLVPVKVSQVALVLQRMHQMGQAELQRQESGEEETAKGVRYILLGDFNAEPDTVTRRYITAREPVDIASYLSVAKSHCEFQHDNTSGYNMDCSAFFRTPLRPPAIALTSSYSHSSPAVCTPVSDRLDCGDASLPNPICCNEPYATTRHRTFTGTLDYVFVGEEVAVKRLMSVPCLSDSYIPDMGCPSDHLPIGATLTFGVGQEPAPSPPTPPPKPRPVSPVPARLEPTPEPTLQFKRPTPPKRQSVWVAMDVDKTKG
ncbi:hypothetical protein KIPB_008114 [Kipferlia bialata]|uniref:Endonuclease/exonuclease/phosphatase domain-containing protein n=1 Tax=Kipferlia bialata TaxID=797122 RepID=A0A9K3GG49_9EUKA|nr:hypothetical protein KIPB_003856 [Kipferlia bialata]GIQ83226.1 hypothetical protein KIPB_004515 [Kipferlia bialata]GIQ86287.1 hypothetical protein KIPB_008114 [Kipferlia bialata]|eukprot:g3856.t1